ncbi:uncharacterized protein LOC110033970 [Phalaenopsis equestris]|uniref:uncharacterized protein LOC110033970 n=1 Tax=Phalaenopsis equestris TaxID=78828 RepID=UPI0009E5B037|nr:uncharacterized protein LOC110033970 [Phalaenopsis equestris]XP_020593823.1 uncharacterized protein LOC110033970 [Phalaenopsis equestris]
MLLGEERDAQARNARSLISFSRSRPIKLGSWRLDRRSIGEVRSGDGDGDCRVCAAAGDFLARFVEREGGEFVGQIGGFSHESEHDLAMMVSDFLEDWSGGAESRYNNDSDSGFPDPKLLAENVRFLKNSVEQNVTALSSSVQSRLLSINDSDLFSCTGGQCNGGCIRHSLVKLLRLSGFDAAVCQSKWQHFGKVPGGDHEYIDVFLSSKSGISDRVIIDIDFRSHFEIARAVKSYDIILNSLPVMYVGSMSKLKKFLQIMVDAAKFSLNQNSMPLPPWRSLPYLQAKWQSEYERKSFSDGQSNTLFDPSDHKQCIGHLRRLKSSLQSEIAGERLLKPITNDKKRTEKFERQQSILSG